MMGFYESIVIIRQDVSSSEVDKIVNDLKKIIKNYKGSIVKSEYWGLRPLAYKIKSNKKGHYYFIGIKADEPKTLLEELGRRIKLSESIIRSSLVKVKEISNELSPILQEAKSDTENIVDVTTKKEQRKNLIQD